jgi:hypothetical protein
MNILYVIFMSASRQLNSFKGYYLKSLRVSFMEDKKVKMKESDLELYLEVYISNDWN